MRPNRFIYFLLAGAGGAAIASAAGAQTAGSAPAAPIAEEIVVTGSRVITNGNNSPTPITVLQADQALSLQPTIIADALNDLPIFSGSQTQVSNPGTTSAASTAAEELNLRNLGTTRTLVLFDGHRLAPTEINAVVDVNMIPQMLLQRVDVVTGGVSAVYGSDAIAGVVNFIEDAKFNGLKLKAQAGASIYGDDQKQDFGIAAGTSLFGERGHFEASYEFYDDAGVLARSDRPWGRDVWTVQGSGTAASPYMLVENTRNGNTSFGGSITSGALAGQYFAQPGVLSPFVPGSPAYTGGYQSGGDGAYNNGSIEAALRSNQLYSRFDFDVTNSIHAYVEGSSTWNFNQQDASYTTLSNVTLSAQNAFLPAAYQNELAAAGQSTFKFSKVLTDSQRLNPEINERQLFLVAGLNGDLGGGYSWDFAYSHSENDTLYTTKGIINNANLSAALNAVVNPANGQIVCHVTLTNPGLYPGCVPLNVFGPSSEGQTALNYITQTGEVGYHFIQNDVSGSVQGAPFRTWAGPVKMSLSGEYHDLLFSAFSNVPATQLANCTGLIYNCTATTGMWNTPTNDRTPVSQKVGEVAAEIEVPLLTNLPFARSLDLNAATRYSNYNTSGGAVTWKVGLDWHIDDQLTIRGTSSVDIRAPNLNDLYSAATTVLIPSTDLLTKTSPLVPTAFAGNPYLTPEVATTWTAGFVYRPSWVPRFSISLDGYNILIRNAITSASGSNALFQNICYASGGSSPYCLLQVRPLGYTNTSAANTVEEWYSSGVNIAQQWTYGADLEANYATTLFGRPLAIRELLDYQPHIIYEQPGVLTYDDAGAAFNSNNLTASPVLRMTAFINFSPIDNLSIGIMERWRSSLRFAPATTLVFDTPTIPSIAYTNLNVTYTLKKPGYGSTDLFVTISNLFNTPPPAAANFGANGSVGLAGGFVSGDDPIGFQYMMGVRFKY